jgi:hypothetical protein
MDLRRSETCMRCGRWPTHSRFGLAPVTSTDIRAVSSLGTRRTAMWASSVGMATGAFCQPHASTHCHISDLIFRAHPLWVA